MDIYPEPDKKRFVSKITMKDMASAVLLMADRAEKEGAAVFFFPEAGALPLKHVFEKLVAGQKKSAAKIFSSKVTAAVKSPLSKQICTILKPSERRRRLSRAQAAGFRKAVAALPVRSRRELLKAIDIGQLESLSLREIIEKIGTIGLYVPSEDESNLAEAGVIPKTRRSGRYLPEDGSPKEFYDFRKRNIAYILDSLSDITHDTRDLLNIVLSETEFAREIRGNRIYVIDEAVSRGRTLNVLEIIFKSFYKDAAWKIGVLFCPLRIVGESKLDFVFSSRKVPPFSNRPDLVGQIVVESSTAFVKYSIDKLLVERENRRPKVKPKQLGSYLKNLRRFASRSFHDFLDPALVTEDDLVRLFHFKFVCQDHDILKRSLNLNPAKTSGLIEETGFYLHMPHPFDSMPIRREYKNRMLQISDKLDRLPASSPLKKSFLRFKEEFRDLREYYELLELRCWSQRYHGRLAEMNKLLKNIRF